MGFVTAKDNVKLFVKDWGAGRPVVMMHGWPLSSDSFDDLSMAIANAGMRAIAYDRRGFGRSDRLLQPRGRGRHPQLSAD